MSTWKSNITTLIPADVSPNAVIQILHDHSFIISLNHLVTHQEKAPHQEGAREIYNITDSIPILPRIWNRTVTYQAQFEDKEDGVWSWVNAPMGITIHGRYVVRVREEGEGGWVLAEEVEASCSALLKGFVERTLVKSHREMHGRILERARGVSKEGEGGGEGVQS